MSTAKERLAVLVGSVEHALEAALTTEKTTGSPARQDALLETMRYAVLGGGKRIRGALALECACLAGGTAQAAMPAACAVEMIHAFSLIHDDLPCMDNDDMRRGKPSCHKAFGEATALLAGDALIFRAFELLTAGAQEGLYSFATGLHLTGELARAAGAAGMTGGQQLDMEAETRSFSLEELQNLQRRKTGALMVAACRMGALAGGGDEALAASVGQYAEKLGLAFQVIDDILDTTGNSVILGKSVGKDERSGKTTYVSALGVEGASRMAFSLTEEAVMLAEGFSDGGFLAALARELGARQR